MKNEDWKAIFDKWEIFKHNFETGHFIINAKQIKDATFHFRKTNEKEVRLLCKQDTRAKRPDLFKEMNLFVLLIKKWYICNIEG